MIGGTCALTVPLPLARSNMVPNLAVVLLLLYWAYYVTLEAFAGVTWGLVIGTPLWVSATWFAAAVPHAWAWALGMFVLSWYMQIHPGHLVLEGRKPALLDSFFQVGRVGRCTAPTWGCCGPPVGGSGCASRDRGGFLLKACQCSIPHA